MTIAVGAHLPEATFRVITENGPAPKTTAELFNDRKVVLFGVPGAFTPTCDRNHLPGYIKHAAEIKAKGVDAILCTSTNDAFVMKAWAEASGGKDIVEFIADGNGDFAKAIGLSFDGSGFGLGIRSQRYAMLVDHGVVKSLHIEDAPGKADISGAEAMIKSL